MHFSQYVKFDWTRFHDYCSLIVSKWSLFSKSKWQHIFSKGLSLQNWITWQLRLGQTQKRNQIPIPNNISYLVIRRGSEIFILRPNFATSADTAKILFNLRMNFWDKRWTKFIENFWSKMFTERIMSHKCSFNFNLTLIYPDPMGHGTWTKR